MARCHTRSEMCSSSSSEVVRLAGAPIQLLVYFHKALGAELNQLHRLAGKLGESVSDRRREMIAEFRRRFEFLKILYKYHCTAEDEVVFAVLDTRIKNVVCAYMLEHNSIDVIFDSISNCLNSLIETEETTSKQCQQLVSNMSTIKTMICHHMLKEEKQIFPFLVKNFSLKEQASIIWQFLCSAPIMILQEIFPWLASFLSPDEHKEILQCIKEVLPEEKHVQEVDKTTHSVLQMYMNRNSLLSKHVTEDSTSFSLNVNIQHCSSSSSQTLQPQSTVEFKGYKSNSSYCESNTVHKCIALYSNKIITHDFSLKKSPITTPFQKLHADYSNASSIFELERRPVDHIFYFHKALRKDLEYLVTLSSDMAKNEMGLEGFRRRFQLLRFLYQIHSDSEDEIAFPALEASGNAVNIIHSYAIDHKLESELFDKIAFHLEEISRSYSVQDEKPLNHRILCLDLHNMCISMRKVLCDHVDREETEIWPLFRECFTIEEQEKIIGTMIGRMSAETLQELIPWLMSSLTIEEQKAIMSLWHKATKNTMFGEWLQEWWEEMKVHDVAKVEEKSNIVPSWKVEPLELFSTYAQNKFCENKDQIENEKCDELPQTNIDDTGKKISEEINHQRSSDFHEQSIEDDKTCKDIENFSTELCNHNHQHIQDCEGLDPKIQEHLPSMGQEELEATIRKISRDSTLDSQKKSHIIQSLLTSHWTISQEKSQSDALVLSIKKEVIGQSPSYRDPIKLTFGCNHYKRNCKLVAACCNRLYTCRLCHDDVNNHSMDRKATTDMMCMKCLRIQPIGPTCSTSTCNNLNMAKYYCKICKLFDDEREIYHCPYCNLCRVGKGLGIDYFHCMNCNACMSKSLSVHPCREKCFEDNCPICHEFLFTSSSPVKALSCGHLMHSTCFQDYTFTHYTCPICSKSLGDMQVYFAMLDALLAEEKVPDEYSGQTQKILCNDCEKRGTATFHWLYHKCSYCGSYNTRLL